jgi:ABC-2 type transport system ATP-binding protein
MLAGTTLPTHGRGVAGAGIKVGYAPGRPAPPLIATAYLAHHTRMCLLLHGGGQARADALAERLGLGAMVDEPRGALSKGSLQKVVVIQAMLARPALVVLDEPFSGLDVDGSQALCELIAEATATATATATASTVVFSDHPARDVRPNAELVWSLSDDDMQEHPGARPMLRLPELPGAINTGNDGKGVRLVIGSQDSDRALAALVSHGWHVVTVGRREPRPGRLDAVGHADPR